MRIDARPILILCILSLVAACRQDQIPPPIGTPTVAPTAVILKPATVTAPYRTIALSGQFVFAPGDSSIWLQDATTFETKPLLKHSQEEYYEAPSFSPDGSQITFVKYAFDKEGGQIKEIHSIDTNGTNDKMLFKPDPTVLKSFLSDPRYSPDGKSIYFTLSTIQNDGTRKQTNQVAHGLITGGEWQIILAEGDHPAISKDGKRLAFLKFNSQQFSSSLWVADSDGGNPRVLLTDDVFAGVIGQSFSPDGKWIVFAASGPPKKALPGASLQMSPQRRKAQAVDEDSCVFGIGMACLVERVFADGLPWDIWLVSSDGSKFEQLTALGLDSPWPAFSKDGRYIALISTNGLFVYDRQSKQVSLLDKEKAHGVLDWYQD